MSVRVPPYLDEHMQANICDHVDCMHLLIHTPVQFVVYAPLAGQEEEENKMDACFDKRRSAVTHIYMICLFIFSLFAIFLFIQKTTKHAHFLS